LEVADKLLDGLIDFLVGLRREAEKELRKELAGGLTGLADFPIVDALEGEEGVSYLRDKAEGLSKLLQAAGVAPVLEGVEVILGDPGAGTLATSGHF